MLLAGRLVALAWLQQVPWLKQASLQEYWMQAPPLVTHQLQL
jgi:hypothetical protein